jgi:NodT family efflux transporter outer membrane factor (OMF) lipoprotein
MIRRLGFVLLAGLTGCMVGPDYVRPSAPTPVAFKEVAGWKPAQPQDDIDRGAWWSVYNDPILDGLERQVEISNQSLKASYFAYEQASAIVQEAVANLFPTAGITGTGTRSKGGGISTSSGTTISGGSRTSSALGSSKRTTYSLEGNASWAPDVWGSVRRTIESDVSGAQASAATLANALLSLQATLATDYMDLRAAEELQILLSDTVAQYQRSLQITQNQYEAGTAAKSDVITAQAQVLSTQASLVNVGVQRAQFEHAIAVLIGKPPAEFSIAPGRLAVAVPVAPVDVPSRLLERRPDIAAAERTMQQQNALIGVAVAAYFPDISLSALGGYSGNPIFAAYNTLWSLAASATQTVFDGGLRGAQVEAARAVYQESVANYRQTVLTAFQGVEDQLAALRILEQQAAVEDEAVKAAKQAVQITINEYRAGTVAYTSVVTAQALLLSDQQSALSVQQSRLVASVALLQDLGGGWDSSQLPPRDDLQKMGPLIPDLGANPT